MTLNSSKFNSIFAALGEALFTFGLLGWMYGVIIQLTNPSLLTVKLSHLTPWLRVDIFTISSFFVSALGFFVWRLVIWARKK
jgi:hypothetical protein